ncbi:MAG TPA: dephospho-CoA kinase [Bacteroidales bacterium]|nr:dephospho-CoA kinase [Bacteroidales bacterium]
MLNNKIPFKLGVTGGIGSGKTSVCRVFHVLGVPVFSADTEASILMECNETIRKELNKIAGRDMFATGKLDRKELASLIFNDSIMLEKVNKLVHPAVFEQFEKWTMQQEGPYVIMEAAILFESGAFRFVDKVVTVTAPVEERIDRVIHRNKLTRVQVLDRIKMQMNDEEKIEKSDYVIRNSENEMIIPAVLLIHEDILKLIKS